MEDHDNSGLVICRMSPEHQDILLGPLGEPIELVAGDGIGSKIFHVHKKILCSLSPYFEAACSSRWLESGSNRISLSTDDPKIVELFVQWMYTGNFGYYEAGQKPLFEARIDTFGTCKNFVDVLTRLYILANKLQIAGLQDRVITELLSSESHHHITLSPPWKYCGINY